MATGRPASNAIWGGGGSGNPGGYYGGSVRISAEDPQTQSGLSAVGGRRSLGADGKTTYDTEYGETTEQNLATRDKYNAAAEQRRWAMMQGLMGSYGSGGGGDKPGLGNINYNEQAARDAAFARAKDQAGNTSRAALDSLRGYAQSSGRLGTNWEGGKAAQVLGEAAGGLGEYTRDQMMLDLNRAGEISDRNLAAQLTMRGQDIQKMASLLGLFNVQGAIY